MLLHSLNCLIIVMLINHTCGDFLQQRLINEPNFPESVDAFFDAGSEEDLEDNFSNLRFIPLLEDSRNLAKRSTNDYSMKLKNGDKVKSDDIINYSTNSGKKRATQVLEEKKGYSSRLSKLRQDLHELNNLVKFISEREHSKFSNKKLKKRIQVTYPTSMKPIFTPVPLHQTRKLAPGTKADDCIIVHYDEDEDYIGDDKERVYPYQNIKRKITIIPQPSCSCQKPPTKVKTKPKEKTQKNFYDINKQTFTYSPNKKLKKKVDNSKTQIWPESVKKIIAEAKQKIQELRQRVKLLKRTNKYKKSNFRKRNTEEKNILEEAEENITNLQNQIKLLIKATSYRKIRNIGNIVVYNTELEKRRKKLKEGIGAICALEERLERQEKQSFRELDSVKTFTPSYYMNTDVSDEEFDSSTIVNKQDEYNQYSDDRINVPSDEEFLSDNFTETELEKAFKNEWDSVRTEKSKLKHTNKKKRNKRNIIFPDLPVHHEVKQKMQKFLTEKNTIAKSRPLHKVNYFPIHYQQRRSDITSSTEDTIPSVKTKEDPEQVTGSVKGREAEVTISEPITLYHSPIFINLPINPPDCTDDDGSFETYYLQQMFPSTESECTELTEVTEAGEPPSGNTKPIDDAATQENVIGTAVIHDSLLEEHGLQENLKFHEKTEGEQKKNNINLRNTINISKKNSVRNCDLDHVETVLAKIREQFQTYMETTTVKDYFADEIFTKYDKNYKSNYKSKIKERDYALTPEQSLKSNSILNLKRQGNDDTQYVYDYGPDDSDYISEQAQDPNDDKENNEIYETETEDILNEAKHLLSNIDNQVGNYKKQKDTAEETIDNLNEESETDTSDEEEIESMHYPDEESDKTHQEFEPDTGYLKDTTMTADKVLADIENELKEYDKLSEDTTTETEEIETTEYLKDTTMPVDKVLQDIENELKEYDKQIEETTFQAEETTESVEKIMNEIQHELEEYEKTTTVESVTFEEEAEHKTENVKKVINEIQHELEEFEEHVKQYDEAKTEISETDESNEETDNIEESEFSEEIAPTEEVVTKNPTEHVETTSHNAEQILGDIKHQLEELQTHIEHETEENQEYITVKHTKQVQTEIKPKEKEIEKGFESTTNKVLKALEYIEHEIENYQHESTGTESESISTEGPKEAEAENLLYNIQYEIKHLKQEYTSVTMQSTTESIEKIIQTIKQEIQQYKEITTDETSVEDDDLNTSYEHLYTELGITNHEIKLSNQCTSSDLRDKNHCICSAQQMLEDLMDDVKEINKTAHYEYTCRRFIRIDPGIIITNKSESKILRKRKTGDFTETFVWKREARVGRDIESLLRKELKLPAKDNVTYVVVGTKVTIPCYEKVDVNKDSNYTWTIHNGAPETTGDRSNNGSSIIIPSVSPEDSNNYTCLTYDRDSQKKSIFIHWLSVVSLPLYSLVVTVHLNASSKCQEGDLEILNLYYPVAIKDLLCLGSVPMCSVTVEKPQCIRLGTEDMISLHVTLSVEPILTILPKLKQNDCSLQCQNRIYSIIVRILLKNLESVTNLPVACEPYTFNPGNEMHCQKCPKGTFQRAGGSRMCLPCSSFLDDPSCLFSAKIADFSRKYYLIPTVMMILLLTLIAGCIMLQKRKSTKKAILMMSKQTRDEEQQISLPQKSIRISENANSKSSTGEEEEIMHKQDSYHFTEVNPKKTKRNKSRTKSNKKGPPKPPPIDF